MWWVASTGAGILAYLLVGALSDSEPLLVRGAWGAAIAIAVLLIKRAQKKGGS